MEDAPYFDQLKLRFGDREAISIRRILLEDGWNLLANAEEKIDLSARQHWLDHCYQRILDNEPVQYIVNIAWFYGLRFKVTPDVLIPRPETEELVEQCLLFIQRKGIKNPSIIDIGTGSGCIPVVMKKKLPDADVYGLDKYSKCIDIAQENANFHDVNIHWITQDIASYVNVDTYHCFDMVISNPPYITQDERSHMTKSTLIHEPSTALFVDDQDPIFYYKLIADWTLKTLKSGGLLAFECNTFFAKDVQAYVEKAGFDNVLLLKDLQGLDRMVLAVR